MHSLDFSNFIGKPSIRAIAEADDHEVVREVQVNICWWFLQEYTWLSLRLPRGFNKHQWLSKCVGYFAHRSWLLFPRKKKQLVWITLQTKNISLNLNENLNYDVLSWRLLGLMLYFSHENAIFQSIFTHFCSHTNSA